MKPMSQNIFNIWDSINQQTPFAVRRSYWSPDSYTVVTRVDSEKMPYGNAYGWFTKNGKREREELIKSSGVYQWSLVEGVPLK
jgi:hypothetical protein